MTSQCSTSTPFSMRTRRCRLSKTTSLLTDFGFEHMEMVRWRSSCSPPMTSPSLLLRLLRSFRIYRVENDYTAQRRTHRLDRARRDVEVMRAGRSESDAAARAQRDAA